MDGDGDSAGGEAEIWGGLGHDVLDTSKATPCNGGPWRALYATLVMPQQAACTQWSPAAHLHGASE